MMYPCECDQNPFIVSLAKSADKLWKHQYDPHQKQYVLHLPFNCSGGGGGVMGHNSDKWMQFIGHTTI